MSRCNDNIATAQGYYPGACPDGTIGRMLMPNRVYSDTNQTQMLVRAITQYAHVSEIDTFTVDTAGWTGTSGGAVSQANRQLVVTVDHVNEATLRSYTTQASQKYQLLLDLDHGDCDSLKVEILDSASTVIASYNNVATSLSYNFTAVNSATKVKVSRQDKNGQSINTFYLNSAVLSEIRDTLYQDTIYTATGNGYRFAFNGKEQDPEWNGVGNSYTTHYRQYDSRIGRWASRDPLESIFPDKSPYNYCFNSPLIFKDQDGDNPIAIVIGFISFFFAAATPASGPGTDEEASEKALREAYSRQGNIIVFGSVASGAPIVLPAASVYLSYETYTTGVAWLYGRAAILKLTTEFTWGLATDEPYPIPFAITDDAGRELRYLMKGAYKFVMKNGATELMTGYAGALYRTGNRLVEYSFSHLNESGVLESVVTGSAKVKDGMLTLGFTVPEILQKRGIGRQMFQDAFNKYADEFDVIAGNWIKSADDGNFKTMVNALASDDSMTLELAAFETFTGQMAKDKGYTKVVVKELEDRFGNVIAYDAQFFKP